MLALSVLTAASFAGAASGAAASPADTAGSAAAVAATVSPPDFGPNVRVFDPSMPTNQIQAVVDAISAAQIENEMGTARYSLFFKPGIYGTAAQPLTFQVGYYTEVAGLGLSPADVTINGRIDVYNRCLKADYCVALNNFWRSISNLTINVTNAASMTDCRKTGNFWAASQASPMRRVNVNGNLTLMDYCTSKPQWASGGFMADSKAGNVVNGSQQQYLVRNSTIGTWTNGVWNQVFAGVRGAPAADFAQPLPDGTTKGSYTTLPTNPLSREKPYLYVDAAGQYNVRVPSASTDSVGTTWESGPTPGRSIPLTNFYLAGPSSSVATINSQLTQGKNLILTPGVYDVARTIAVTRADTVVLGLGMATLTAVNGAVPVAVGSVKGVIVAGITVDAGTVNSPALMTIGAQRVAGAPACTACSDPADPTTLSDVFFRIGGPHVGKATIALVVNSDNAILDDIWSWRADHGVDGSVGWNINSSDTGLVVNGDNVTATGLFVEHYKKYNVIWNGENGKTIMFQNELPYDPPDQAAWQHGGVLGWAAYKVEPSVRTHELWGGGSYIYTNVNPSLHATRAFEAPATPGVAFHHLLTVQLKAGFIDHVINDAGAVTPWPDAERSFVVEFGTTVTTPPTTTPTPPPTSTTPTPPGSGTPSGLRAGNTSHSVTLSWTGDAGATYDILRGEAGVKIASVQGNTFTDDKLGANTPYVYAVRGPGGTTPQLTVVTGSASTPTTATPTPTTAPAPPTTTPPAAGAPSNLHRAAQTSSTLTIRWDGPAGATYDILRGEAGDRIATVTGNTVTGNTFTDIGLLTNTPYVYSVRNSAGATPQITLTIN